MCLEGSTGGADADTELLRDGLPRGAGRLEGGNLGVTATVHVQFTRSNLTFTGEGSPMSNLLLF